MAGLADAEEGADAQVDEASEPEERKGSGEESEAAAGHAGGIASDSESVMDPAVTGAQRIGASGSTLKFRGAISHECISS